MFRLADGWYGLAAVKEIKAERFTYEANGEFDKEQKQVYSATLRAIPSYKDGKGDAVANIKPDDILNPEPSTQDLPEFTIYFASGVEGIAGNSITAGRPQKGKVFIKWSVAMAMLTWANIDLGELGVPKALEGKTVRPIPVKLGFKPGGGDYNDEARNFLVGWAEDLAGFAAEKRAAAATLALAQSTMGKANAAAISGKAGPLAAVMGADDKKETFTIVKPVSAAAETMTLDATKDAQGKGKGKGKSE